ncbi:venom serine protease isoform X2 [Solenopsis invicta]|uniref:venom serine protease isoform X2 n=1 Tax=Solenopsis invicta TaxID=13686 RepID=UPI000595FC2F|nr:venom serine protease isoform X2 [Solenopsis invicta]
MEAVKVVLFGILLCLVTLNGAQSDCKYFQQLQADQTYYAYNPGFPNMYEGEKHCVWETEGRSVTQVNCSNDMNNYCQDTLTVQFDGNNKYTSCGYNEFILQGMNPIIRFDSWSSNSQGQFLCEIKTLNNQCQCGWSKVTRIVGGRETGINEYPMMAGLVSYGRRELFCGCTIISSEYILTAAHCLKDQDIIGDIAALVGEHDTTTGDETKATVLYRLEGCVIHPNYYENTGDNDVAVCKTSKTITFSANVGPACLPFRLRYKSFAGSNVTALGWGMMEFGGPKATRLQKVNLNVITLEECQNRLPNQGIKVQDLCTYTDGKDTCQMDSGGPLLWQDPITHNLVIVGIISSGEGCASNSPAISKRVGYFVDWITSVTSGAQYCAVE